MSRTSLKRIAIIFAAIASALFIQACGVDVSPEKDCNFVQNSQLQRVSWNNRDVRFYIHQSVPSDMRSALYDAADAWNDIIGRNIIQIQAVVGGSDTPKRDGYNIIYYLTEWESEKTSEQARTTIYWSGSNIYEADVRLNGASSTSGYRYHNFSAADSPQSGKVDLVSLMIHEFGHVLGLRHVSADTVSVMHANLSTGTLRRDISEIDQGSIACEY